MALRIAILGAIEKGFGMRSKIGSRNFLPVFERTLRSLDMVPNHFTYRQFTETDVRADAAILVYQEVGALQNPALWTVIEQAARAAETRNILVVHSPSVGRIVADKTLTHNALSAAGVPMPRLLSGTGAAPFKVFSNENAGTHTPVVVINEGD